MCLYVRLVLCVYALCCLCAHCVVLFAFPIVLALLATNEAGRTKTSTCVYIQRAVQEQRPSHFSEQRTACTFAAPPPSQSEKRRNCCLAPTNQGQRPAAISTSPRRPTKNCSRRNKITRTTTSSRTRARNPSSSWWSATHSGGNKRNQITLHGGKGEATCAHAFCTAHPPPGGFAGGSD